MKKIILIILIISTSLLAIGIDNNTKLALQIHQSKKVDKVVKRTNELYKFVNLFLMETGRVERLTSSTRQDNMDQLIARYGSTIRTSSYNNNINIEFIVETRTVTINHVDHVFAQNVTFYNVVPDTIGTYTKQMYKHNNNLHPNAVVNSDLSITYILKPETIGFMNYSSMLQQTENNASDITVGIPASEPTCTLASQKGNTWYIPNGRGEFYMYVCDTLPSAAGFGYQKMTHGLDIALVRESQAKLTEVYPTVGTVGYYQDTTNPTILHKMIFVGDQDGDGEVTDELTIKGWAEVRYTTSSPTP